MDDNAGPATATASGVDVDATTRDGRRQGRPGTRVRLSAGQRRAMAAARDRVSSGDLSDAEWALLEPLLPGPVGHGRPPVRSKRQLIDGIRWHFHTGGPWQSMPARYGPWQTVYALFRGWRRDGTWKAILERLEAGEDAHHVITWKAYL